MWALDEVMLDPNNIMNPGRWNLDAAYTDMEGEK
jgi:hypothetical protein